MRILLTLLFATGVFCLALGCSPTTEDTSKKDKTTKKEEKKDDKKDTKKDDKKDSKKDDKKDEKKPSISLKTESMEVDKGKSAKTTVSITKKDFDDDVTLKFEAPKDSDLKISPAEAKIEKGNNKAEVEITAGDKTGDFEVTVTATGKDVKDTGKLKVKVK